MLVTRRACSADEWVLVWGIGSGVSTAGLRDRESARRARRSSPRRATRSSRRRGELGADATLNHETRRRRRARQGADRRRRHVVVEHVGEATWKRSLDAARADGRIVVCGATTGPNPPAALHRIWWKQLDDLRLDDGHARRLRGGLELVTSGRARPVVDPVFPLAEAAAAHERLEAGEQLGKIVLRIPARA